MPTVVSADGTPIGYESAGAGPALVLVDGAMCYRAAGPLRPLAERLREHFTVYTYDRRGRGESGDTRPYDPARETEDLLALDEALRQFEAEEPFRARLVKLRYFAGMSIPDAAAALGVSVATAKRHWVYARSWLFGKLRNS